MSKSSQFMRWGSYVLQVKCSNAWSPSVDGRTYLWALNLGEYTGLGRTSQQYIPLAGRIKKIYVFQLITGTLANSLTSSLYFQLNGTTDTLITDSFVQDTESLVFSKTDCDISVVEGDYFFFKFTAPSWPTNPTSIWYNSVVYIEVP